MCVSPFLTFGIGPRAILQEAAKRVDLLIAGATKARMGQDYDKALDKVEAALDTVQQCSTSTGYRMMRAHDEMMHVRATLVCLFWFHGVCKGVPSLDA